MEVHLAELREGESSEQLDLTSRCIEPSGLQQHYRSMIVDSRRASGWMGPLLAAPLALRAYLLFALVTIVADGSSVTLPALEPWRLFFVPYTGWNASLAYMFTFYFAAALPYQPPAARAGSRLVGIVMLHFIVMASGVLQIFWAQVRPSGNPYLAVSPLRFVWVILFPLFWIAVLFTPSMNRLCRVNPGKSEV